jgi:hypothetical protein
MEHEAPPVLAQEGHDFSRAAQVPRSRGLKPLRGRSFRDSEPQALKRAEFWVLAARVNSCPSRFLEKRFDVQDQRPRSEV